MEKTTFPTPPQNPFLGSLPAFRNDRIAFLHRVADEQGDVARARFGMVPVWILSTAELVQKVLVEHADAFMKGYGMSVFGKPLLGDGLLTSEGELHKRQRRLLAPAFAQKRLAGYAPIMTHLAEATARALDDGATVDVSQIMMRLTLEIAGKTLFGSEIGDEAIEIAQAITEAMEYMITSLNATIPLPPSVPTPRRRRVDKAIARLDETVYRLIRERRAAANDTGDFLSMLLLAQDEGGGGMSDKQVRDEAMTIFIAGHETTANALSWTFYLLGRHPAARTRLEGELAATLAGRTPTLADLPRLPYTLQVFKEAMRLYPPAYLTTRRALRDIMIGDVPVKKNEVVMLNIAGLHRRKAHFPEPHRFDPDRFAPEAEKKLPRLAFMPFGAGPRVCIGNHFALMEGHLVLATLAQRLRFDPQPGSRRVDPEPLVTLRPGGGMPMLVTRRVSASEPSIAQA